MGDRKKSRQRISIRKRFSALPEITQLLILSVLFSMLLIAVRVWVTGEIFLLMLPWNLFLAWAPYGITQWLSLHPDWIENRLKFAIGFIAWLLFIPNAFYILTDLFHLGQSHGAPRWYDLAVIFSFAWNGLLMAVLSVRRMQLMITLHFSLLRGWMFVLPVMWLNALGVYIGRYLRYNSWDVLTSPFELSTDILYLLLHPFRNAEEWGMIFCFTLLLYFIYEGIRLLTREPG